MINAIFYVQTTGCQWRALPEDCLYQGLLRPRDRGLPGALVREMLIETAGMRFGAVEAVPSEHALELLTDNGGALHRDRHAAHRRISWSETGQHARVPFAEQRHGRELRQHPWRDHVGCMDLTDAPTVLAQLPTAFEHFNEVHPHSGLKMKSPRKLRRHQAPHCG